MLVATRDDECGRSGNENIAYFTRQIGWPRLIKLNGYTVDAKSVDLHSRCAPGSFGHIEAGLLLLNVGLHLESEGSPGSRSLLVRRKRQATQGGPSANPKSPK